MGFSGRKRRDTASRNLAHCTEADLWFAMDATPTPPPSERGRIRRIAEKAHYDRDVIDAILDAGLIAHLGLIATDGSPVVIPTTFARDGDRVIVHGSAASRLIRAGASGVEMSLAVTLFDGMVVARSLFESSMAFRSVVVLGRAVAIYDPDEKLAALLHLSDRLIPGRVAEARLPTDLELRATRVFALPLDEASAKVSDSSVSDDPADLTLPIWAGFIPVAEVAGMPVAAPGVAPDIDVPQSVARWTPIR